ncbi:MAG: class I SAM-dependent methyltransferase [candidate division Zixibacteria bacterium]|nr:class I SAM-dependent methyltransferase [candidate division Zixibacteria bacterium]
MSDTYNNARYYEIAFSFRDIIAEVDVFEELFKRYSNIRVKSVLEIACGACPHMMELARRGYKYVGLDLNEEMLKYSRDRAVESGIDAEIIRADMVDFKINEQVDFAYIMLGSLSVKSNSELASHFSAVACAVKSGGLYLLDWCIQFEGHHENDEGSSWDMEEAGIKVSTNVKWKPLDLAEQVFEEVITFDINDNGKRVRISGSEIKKAIYPQEFLLFVSAHKDWEFIGWWNNWNLADPLEKYSKTAQKISRPIVVLRKI